MTDAGICASSYIELPQAGVQSDDAGGRDDNDDIEHEIVQKDNFFLQINFKLAVLSLQRPKQNKDR